MNKNTRSRLKLLVHSLKKQGRRTTGFKARKTPYPQHDKRPDLAGSFGYNYTGKYVGKPWATCW